MSLPYLPAGRTIEYVPLENPFMQAAKLVAETESLDQDHATGAVLVRDGEIIAAGANGSTYHEQYGCARKEKNIPTGEGYELCEGCHPKNHAEQTAIANCENPSGADCYLWGHWWCCQSCWEKMMASGIINVYLPVGATEMFKK